MSIEHEISDLFMQKGYTWKVGEDKFIPAPEQVREHIDRMKAELDDGDQIASGRMIIARTNDTYDIFVLIGEEHGNDS